MRAPSIALLVGLASSSLALGQAPAELRLTPGETHRYQRVVEVELEGRLGERELQHTISLQGSFQLTVGEGGAQGPLIDVTIGRCTVGQAANGQEESWALEPPAEPVGVTVITDPRGRMLMLQGASLRQAFVERGCSARLGKIPAIYLWGSHGSLDGGVLGTALLPKEVSSEWETVTRVTYGPGGLLDDFSTFRETWAWAAKTEQGELRVTGTLRSVELAEAFGGEAIAIAAAKGEASLVLDPASGLPLRGTRQHSFQLSLPKDDYTGTITRTERVTTPARHQGKTLDEWIDELGVAGIDADDNSRRGLAANMLREMGAEAAPAVPALIQALDERDSIIRVELALTLAGLVPHSEAALPPLLGLLQNDASASVRWRVAAALGDLGPAAKGALQALEAAQADDRDASVRKYAGQAIEKIRAE